MEIRLTGNLTGSSAVPGTGQAPAKELGWQPGQVLQGKVMGQAGEDAYLIKVDGREVVAHSPLPLTKGQTIAMEVQGQKDGAFLVKLLSTAPAVGSADLGEVLSRLGLKDTPLNRTLVQEFMARNLPLKPELLLQASRLVQGLGGSVAGRVQTVTLALEGGIPLKGPLVEALHSFLEGFRQGNGGQEVLTASKFLSQLGELVGEETGGGQAPLATGAASLNGKGESGLSPAETGKLPGGRSPATGVQFTAGEGSQVGLATGSSGRQGSAAAIVQSGVQEFPVPQEGAKVLFQQLRDLTRALALQPEGEGGQVATQLKELLTAQLPRGGGQPFGSIETEGNQLDTDGNIAKGSQTVGTLGGPGPEVVIAEPSRVQQPLGKSDLLNQLLNGLKKPGSLENLSVDILSSETASVREPSLPVGGEKPSPFSPQVERLFRLIQEVHQLADQAGDDPTVQGLFKEGASLEKQVVGQQLMQTLDRGEQKSDFLYFSLPLTPKGQEESWGQLRIAKDGKKGRVIDPNRFSLALLLNTENLGPLLLEIKVWDKEVKASGKTAEEGIVQAFRLAWPALQERFAAMGFRLQTGEWQVGPVEKSLLPEGERGLQPPLDLSFLDVKV